MNHLNRYLRFKKLFKSFYSWFFFLLFFFSPVLMVFFFSLSFSPVSGQNNLEFIYILFSSKIVCYNLPWEHFVLINNIMCALQCTTIWDLCLELDNWRTK
jgi:hypothetical protein